MRGIFEIFLEKSDEEVEENGDTSLHTSQRMSYPTFLIVIKLNFIEKNKDKQINIKY